MKRSMLVVNARLIGDKNKPESIILVARSFCLSPFLAAVAAWLLAGTLLQPVRADEPSPDEAAHMQVTATDDGKLLYAVHELKALVAAQQQELDRQKEELESQRQMLTQTQALIAELQEGRVDSVAASDPATQPEPPRSRIRVVITPRQARQKSRWLSLQRRIHHFRRLSSRRSRPTPCCVILPIRYTTRPSPVRGAYPAPPRQ